MELPHLYPVNVCQAGEDSFGQVGAQGSRLLSAHPLWMDEQVKIHLKPPHPSPLPGGGEGVDVALPAHLSILHDMTAPEPDGEVLPRGSGFEAWARVMDMAATSPCGAR